MATLNPAELEQLLQEKDAMINSLKEKAKGLMYINMRVQLTLTAFLNSLHFEIKGRAIRSPSDSRKGLEASASGLPFQIF